MRGNARVMREGIARQKGLRQGRWAAAGERGAVDTARTMRPPGRGRVDTARECGMAEAVAAWHTGAGIAQYLSAI